MTDEERAAALAIALWARDTGVRLSLIAKVIPRHWTESAARLARLAHEIETLRREYDRFLHEEKRA